MGDAVDLHPAVIILSLVVGGVLFGMGGAILAAPVVALGRDLYRYGFRRCDGDGADAASWRSLPRWRPIRRSRSRGRNAARARNRGACRGLTRRQAGTHRVPLEGRSRACIRTDWRMPMPNSREIMDEPP